MSPRLVRACGWLPFAFCLCTPTAFAAERRPNVVLIMTDNHGAWTLGCYGNKEIRTPNIDRLATEGTLFTQAFASNPVCSPTRATFLTGLIPSQHGVHCFLTGGRLQVGPDARCTLDEFTSLPEVLRDQGYRCGLVGKWHLGDNLRPQEGFDDYWITMPHGGTSTFYDAQVIEDGKIRREGEYLTDFWTRHAVTFIEQQADSDQPFFLFLAYNGPYSLSRLLLREGKNRHAAYYADQTLESFPRQPTHPWQLSNRDYHNNPTSIRRVATEVSGIDDGVGTVMDSLRENGVDEDTIVIFVADQGWSGGHGGFFGMGDHTRPVTATDPMMKIPMIWRHPSGIRAGFQSPRLISNYDFMPTLLGYLGLDEQMPNSPRSPGRDVSSELAIDRQPAVERDTDDAVFYEFEGLRCIRTERWKYIHRHPNGPHELYDLEQDPQEFDNLLDRPEQSGNRQQLQSRLNQFFGKYASPEYDMWNGGGSQARVFVGIDEELAQQVAPEPAPLSGGFRPAKINVPDGFSVELVAGPPLVSHPTLGCFDDRGRLFLCDNAGVNLSAEQLEEQLPNTIRMLEDVDGDGRFDRSTVFADKMTYPMGGAWCDGALYVASPPNIWRLQDTDDDGVADRRDILVSEFGYTGNAASIHGCFNGPDGRIYWCDGFHGHEFADENGTVTSKRNGSYLFSARRDGSDIRIHCGGGMDNPVEVDFTDQGEMIGSVNIIYSRPRVDALVHWLYGGVYPHRERILEETQVTGDFLTPMHRFGHVAVSGVTRYRSGAIDHRWTDDYFATFFNSGKVVRLELERDGASFRATQREFLSSTQRDFHPTDVIEDADGSLLVVDTGGWFYRGCPTSQLSKPDVLGGVYRIRRDGMTTQVDPLGKRIEWESLADADLVRLFNDTRHRVRQQATEQAAERGPEMVDALRRTTTGDLRVRQNSIWTLTRLVGNHPDAQSARKLIREFLSDPVETIRLTACRSIATYPDPEATEQLQRLLRDPSAAVRREAATALGRIGDSQSAEPLLARLSRTPTPNRSEEHAVIYALIEIGDPRALRRALGDADPGVQRAALIALQQIDRNAPANATLAMLLTADERMLQQSAAKTALDRIRRSGDGDYRDSLLEECGPAVAEFLNQRILENELDNDSRRLVSELIGAFAASEPVAERIENWISDSEFDAPQRVALDALARAGINDFDPRWKSSLDRLLNSEDDDRVRAAIRAVAAVPTDTFNEPLRAIADDEHRSGLTRVSALNALSGGSSRLNDTSFVVLIDLLTGDRPGDAEEAAGMIASSRLEDRQLAELAEHLEEAGPSALRDLMRPFNRSLPAEVAETLIGSLERAKNLEAVPANEISDVIKRFPTDLLSRANRLLDQLRQRDQEKVAMIDQLIPMVEHASPERGRDVYASVAAACSTCHRVGEEGSRIGPDLTTIGRNRSTQDLIESILFPSASIVRQYETSVALTSDGQVYSGVIVNETADRIEMQQQRGEPIVLERDQIEQLKPTASSIMPTGLDKNLTPQQLADLVAWLKTLGR